MDEVNVDVFGYDVRVRLYDTNENLPIVGLKVKDRHSDERLTMALSLTEVQRLVDALRAIPGVE